MSHLFWQRCTSCGRLTLTRLGGASACPCSRIGRSVAPPLRPVRPPAGALGRVGGGGVGLLTAEQERAVRRLLEQALPDGLDL